MVLINFSSYYNYAFWIDNFKVFERAAHKEKKDNEFEYIMNYNDNHSKSPSKNYSKIKRNV